MDRCGFAALLWNRLDCRRSLARPALVLGPSRIVGGLTLLALLFCFSRSLGSLKNPAFFGSSGRFRSFPFQLFLFFLARGLRYLAALLLIPFAGGRCFISFLSFLIPEWPGFRLADNLGKLRLFFYA
jgi:hypothetical protein